MRRNWTQEEVDYLRNAWGNVRLGLICKNLSRSENSVLQKVYRLHLGAFLENSIYITKNQLFKALGLNYSNSYSKISWFLSRGLKTHKVRRNEHVFEMVMIEEFWDWAYKNQCFLDFSKFEKNSLGAEPEWVERKRKADIVRIQQIKTTPWTKWEDNYLSELLKKQKYGYKELSKILCRSEGAIQRRICDLNIRYRPVKADNHIPWSEEEFEILGEMIKKGCKYEEISEKINRSAKAIRGRVFDYYLTERLDKVRAYIGNGQFGDNLPDRTIKYKRFMSDEDKEKVKVLLSMLAGEIKCVAKENSNVESEYADFWQKEYCTHWDSVKGCTANEKDCDSCTSFKRVEPQFCKRCGITFFERKSNDICNACRSARIKQAQRKYAILSNKRRM